MGKLCLRKKSDVPAILSSASGVASVPLYLLVVMNGGILPLYSHCILNGYVACERSQWQKYCPKVLIVQKKLICKLYLATLYQYHYLLLVLMALNTLPTKQFSRTPGKKDL